MSDDNPYAPSYAPKSNVVCPTTPLVRTFSSTNASINPDEAAYIASREKLLPQAWQDWLGDASHLGYNLSTFLEAGAMPRVGLACSGGGFRASMYAAGILNALDARNDTAKARGTGGLLQVSSYIAGASGGSWVTSSLAYNGFPPPRALVLGDTSLNLPGWLLDLDIAIPDGIDILNTKNQHYYGTVLSSVYTKAEAGFDTSLTDPWSRLLSFHFLNGTNRDNFFANSSSHGAGLLWSDLPSTPALSSFQMPFPIVIANSQPGTETGPTDRPPLNAVVYEITPFEMGSFDPSLGAMTQTRYLGTKLVHGVPDNDSACVTHFDQAGFVIGTSSSLFNIVLDRAQGIIDGFDAGVGKALVALLDRLIQKVTTRRDDVANWPNPFNAISPASFQDANQTWLNLVDGGENAANVPIEQLLVKSRQVDVVIALDNTGETTLGTKNNWPNGTAIRTSRQRITTLLSNSHQGFPPVPDDFASTGVNLRPTFFGCDPSDPPAFPLIVYIPNAPPFDGADPVTNPSVSKSSYSIKHQSLFFDQTLDTASAGFMPGTGAADPDFSKCLQCAVVDRARFRVRNGGVSSPSPTSSPSSPLPSSFPSSSGTSLSPRQTSSPSSGTPLPRSPFCSQCLQKYCFNPANPPSNSDLPNRKFIFVSPDPPSTLSKAETFIKLHGVQLAIGVGVGVLVLILACAAFAIVRRRRRLSRDRAAKLANVTYVPIYDADAAAWDHDGRASYEMTSAAGAGYTDPYDPPVAATGLPHGAAPPYRV